MTSTPGADRPRSFFDRLTEPFTDRAREKFEQAEDHVREAIQHEIDAVARSVRSRAIEVRPSAIGFGVAALLSVLRSRAARSRPACWACPTRSSPGWPR